MTTIVKKIKKEMNNLTSLKSTTITEHNKVLLNDDGTVYYATLSNCVDLYLYDDSKPPVQGIKAKNTDFNLKVKLGLYKGAYTNGSMNRQTYLLFDLDTKKLLILKDDIKEIEADGATPLVSQVAGQEVAGQSSASNSSTVPADGIPPNASQLQNTLNKSQSQLENNKISNLQELENPTNNILQPPISSQKSVHAFDSAFDDPGENVDDDESIDLTKYGNDQSGKDTNIKPGSGGGKRRTSRRGGASKKRVSKKERKTRKAKRAGRKA